MAGIEKQPMRNKDADWGWSEAALRDYIARNYGELYPEDMILAGSAVSTISLLPTLPGDLRHEHGTVKQALHIGIGGVPRGSALISPLMHENGTIVMGDIGSEKLAVTRDTITQIKLGNLGIWGAHQEQMTECNPIYEGAFQKAAHLGEVMELNVFDLPEREFGVVTAEFFPESATEYEEEYDEMMLKLCLAAKIGGVVHMAYMKESHGYEVGKGKDERERMPALAITGEKVENSFTKNGVHVLSNTTTLAPNLGRNPNLGMGVAVGIVKGD